MKGFSFFCVNHLVEISVHSENQLPRYPGSDLKVCVGDEPITLNYDYEVSASQGLFILETQ